MKAFVQIVKPMFINAPSDIYKAILLDGVFKICFNESHYDVESLHKKLQKYLDNALNGLYLCEDNPTHLYDIIPNDSVLLVLDMDSEETILKITLQR